MNIQDIIQYFNIGVLVFVGFFALVGFIRGTYKSVFYLVATLIVFVGGFFLMGTFIKVLLSFNLESFNLSIEGVEMKTLNQFLPDYIIHSAPNAASLMTEDTLVKELVFSLTSMLIKLIYLIIIVVLSITLFKLLTDIFWWIFKPKKKKGQKRKKKTILSRFGGAGIGTLKGAFYLLLICFPLAGVVSITQALVVESDNSQEMQYNLVFVDDSVTLVESESNPNPITQELEQFLEYVGIYQNSFAGKFFGTIPVDEFVFDTIFSFKINKTDIALRKELTTIANAFAKSSKFIEGDGFSINKLLADDPEVLRGIIDEISNLELIKVAIPMGIESMLYLKDKNDNPVVDLPENLDIDMEQIKALDYTGDIKKLGYAFVDFASLVPLDGETTKINYLDFDSETVKKIMDNVGETDIVDKLSPVVISYVATMASVKSSLASLGMTIEDLGITDIESWGAELTQFGKIYEKIAALQIKALDNTETFEFVTEEKVTALSNALFESKLIENAAPVLVKYASDSLMPDDFKGILNIDTTFVNANEFGAVLNASLILKKTKLLEGGEDAFKNLTNDQTNDLSKYLSQSKLITSNLNLLIDKVINNLNVFENKVEFISLTNEEWNNKELSSLFNSFKLILESGFDNIIKLEDEKITELSTHLANSKFITRNFDVIADKALAQINLGEDITLGKFENWDDIEAGEKELFYLFKSARIISDKGSDTEALLKLTQEELNIFLESELISETLVNVLKSYSQPGKQLEFLVGVEEDTIKWDDTDFSETTYTLVGNQITINPVVGANKYHIYGDDVLITSTRNLEYTITLDVMPDEIKVKAFNEGELRKIFSVMGSFMSSISGDAGFSTEMISKMSDEDIEGIVASDILILSIVKKLEDMILNQPGFDFVVIPEGELKSPIRGTKLSAWKGNGVVDGELAFALRGIRLLMNGMDINNFKPEDITNISDDNIVEILQSVVLSESIIVQIEKQSDSLDSPVKIPENKDLGKADPRDVWMNTYQYDEEGRLLSHNDGELAKTLTALKIILDGQDFNNIDVNKILNKEVRKTALKSIVMESTIINFVEKEAEKEGSIIAIPNKLKNNNDLWYNLPKNGDGELEKLLNSLDFIMDEDTSLTNLVLDFELIIENKNEILKSDVLIESVIKKISEQSEVISIPKEMGLDNEEDRSTWTNNYIMDENQNFTYDVDGNVQISKYGEVSHLLDAVDMVIKPDEVTGKKSFDNIDFNISAAFDKQKQETILKSMVISETIVSKIFEESEKPGSMIRIPKSSEYINLREENTREKWYNKYIDEVLDKEGEIAHLLDAADIIIEADPVTGEKNFDVVTFKLDIAFEGNNKDIILKSTIISETIVQYIFDEADKDDPNLYIPSIKYLNKRDDNNRNYWYNDYSGEEVIEGELSILLEVVQLLLDGKPFEELEFDLSAAFDKTKQETILQSKIISETIVNKIFSESKNGEIKIPSSNYVNDITDIDRSLWYNDYSGEELVEGEIANLLNAVNLLLESEAVKDFAGMKFDLSNAFDKDKQPIILKSKVISESIVNKIFNESKTENDQIIIPSYKYVNAEDDLDRNLWYNDYSGEELVEGEIAHLLNAANILLSLQDKADFAGIVFDIDALFEKDTQIEILKSTVFSESIIKKIISNENVVPTLTFPDNDLEGRSLIDSDNREAWFNIDGKENELAKFLDGIKVIVGDKSFAEMESITVDYILERDIIISVNEEKIVTDSPIKTLLNSMILETIISPLVEEIANDTLSTFLVVPEGGYNFYKTNLITDNDLTTYDETKYDTQSFLESLYLMNQAGFKYDEIASIAFTGMDDIQRQGFSEAMVTSRVFKGSIEQMINAIIKPIYNPIPEPIKKSWDEVRLYQVDYDGTNLEAYNNLYQKLIDLGDHNYYYNF